MHTSLLILSGTHGDEYEVIECVRTYINNHASTFADYVYISEVSPSSVMQKTRKNIYLHDVNREFIDPPRDREVQSVMRKLRSYQFDICINFHEDRDRTQSFYLYDSGSLSDQQIEQFRQIITATGADLYNGIDDEKDQDLNLYIRKGYISTPFDEPQKNGFLEDWLVSQRIVRRIFVPEIPGKAPIDLKMKLVEAVFSFCLPFLPQS